MRAALVALAVAVPASAWAWETMLHQESAPAADAYVQAAIDPDGLVVLVSRHGYGVARVRKVAAATGFVLWERELRDAVATASPEPIVATDAAGDVFLALLTNSGTANTWVVAKLAGADGRELWRVEVLNPHNADLFAAVHALAVDAGGDVAVAGVLDHGQDESEHDLDLVALKLDGTTGAERWRRAITGVAPPPDPEGWFAFDGSSDAGYGLAVDGGGRVVVAGTVQNGLDRPLTVIAFDGADGAERWRYALPAGSAHAVRAAAGGGVVVAGEHGTGIALVRLGADGAEIWKHLVPSVGGGATVVRGLALLADDTAIVATRASSPPALPAVELHAVAADGTPGWERSLAAPPVGAVEVRRLAVAGDDVVVVGDAAASPGVATPPRLFAARVAGSDGAVRWSVAFAGDPPSGAAGNAAAVAPGGVVVAGSAFVEEGDVDAVAVGLAPDDGIQRWRADVGTSDRSADAANAVAFDPVGDVLAVGRLGYQLGVAKLAGASGRERWRRTLEWGLGSGVAAFTGGDVAVIGSQFGAGSDTVVARLDGVSGADRWQVHLPGYSSPPGFALAADQDVVVTAAGTVHRRSSVDGARRWELATSLVDGRLTAAVVDHAGDVLAAGAARAGAFGPFRLAVVKADGATGTERWATLVAPVTSGSGRAYATALATDAIGDVFVTGSLTDEASGFDLVVLKLRGSDGAELWRRVLAIGTGNSIAIAPDGDVLVGADVEEEPLGPADRVATVFRLAGADGEARWRHAIRGGAPALLRLQPSLQTWVALGPDGDVLAAGFVGDPTTDTDLAVVRLDPTDGRERWRRTLDGTAVDEARGEAPGDYATALALDTTGHVAVAGITLNAGTEEDFTVLRFPGDGDDRPRGRARVCARTVGKAGARLLQARLRMLEACRRSGTTTLAACADARLAPFAARLRSAIARRCSDAELAALGACADTLDGVLGRSGVSGCLVASHRAAADALAALLGSRDDGRCRSVLASLVRRHAGAMLGARRRCEEVACRSLPTEPAWVGRGFARGVRACRAADLTDACAADAAGLARCLARADRIVADVLADAQLARRRARGEP